VANEVIDEMKMKQCVIF